VSFELLRSRRTAATLHTVLHCLESEASNTSLLCLGELMKKFLAIGIGSAPLFAATAAMAQNSQMMSDGVWGMGWMGGYGGIWVPILLVVVVAAAVAVVMQRKSK